MKFCGELMEAVEDIKIGGKHFSVFDLLAKEKLHIYVTLSRLIRYKEMCSASLQLTHSLMELSHS
jgi:hypothetical protein